MKYIFLLSLFGAFCLTGCASVGISKIEPDSIISNLTIGERYQRFQKESLGFVGKSVIDSQGNTLSEDELKKLFEEKKDTEAVKQLSESWIKGEISTLVISGIFAGECFFLKDRVDRSAIAEAITPYAALSVGTAWFGFYLLFNSDVRKEANIFSAAGIYNYHLRQRLGLEQPKRM